MTQSKCSLCLILETRFLKDSNLGEIEEGEATLISKQATESTIVLTTWKVGIQAESML